MKIRVTCVILAALLAAAGRSAPGQSPPASQPAGGALSASGGKLTPAQQWAYRSARAAAATSMADEIRALPPGQKVTIGDMLARAGAPGLELELALLATADESGASHQADGTCDVGLLVTRSQAVEALAAAYRHANILADVTTLKLPGGKPALRGAGRATAPVGLGTITRVTPRSGRNTFDLAPADVRAFWTKHVRPDDRAAAEKAARSDAMIRLTLQAEALPFTETQTLAQYLAGLGGGRDDLRRCLLGARESAMSYEPHAAIVRAEYEIARRTVYACAKAWLHRQPKPAATDIRRFEQLIVANRGSMLRQAGLAAVSDKVLIDPTDAMVAAVDRVAKAPPWFGVAMRITGRATVPEAASDDFDARRAAAEAAQLTARMNLARRAAGLKLDDRRTVADWARRGPSERQALLTVLEGASTVGDATFTEEGTVEVTLALPLGPLWRLAGTGGK